jgi:Glyoxalase/Bleomycin resistance protein/Dioxygenase superfamily
MQTLGWGQRLGAVAQIAFVVEDLSAAIAHFIRDHGAGPFFVLENFLQPGQTYRGQPSRADVRIGMGFSGATWFELIQPLDDQPSVYKETIEARGYGFHHHGIFHSDCEAACADYTLRGWREAFRAAVPTGGEVIYLDNPASAAPGFVELLPATPGADATFTRFWRAAQDWDGADPVRPFI